MFAFVSIINCLHCIHRRFRPMRSINGLQMHFRPQNSIREIRERIVQQRGYTGDHGHAFHKVKLFQRNTELQDARQMDCYAKNSLQDTVGKFGHSLISALQTLPDCKVTFQKCVLHPWAISRHREAITVHNMLNLNVLKINILLCAYSLSRSC